MKEDAYREKIEVIFQSVVERRRKDGLSDNSRLATNRDALRLFSARRSTDRKMRKSTQRDNEVEFTSS